MDIYVCTTPAAMCLRATCDIPNSVRGPLRVGPALYIHTSERGIGTPGRQRALYVYYGVASLQPPVQLSHETENGVANGLVTLPQQCMASPTGL